MLDDNAVGKGPTALNTKRCGPETKNLVNPLLSLWDGVAMTSYVCKHSHKRGRDKRYKTAGLLKITARMIKAKVQRRVIQE